MHCMSAHAAPSARDPDLMRLLRLALPLALAQHRRSAMSPRCAAGAGSEVPTAPGSSPALLPAVVLTGLALET